MQNSQTFEYAIIRVVPRVEREEFFNVGVILFSKRNKFLGIKYNINKDKLKAFSTDVELEMLEDYLNAWKLICDGDPHGGKIGTFELSDRFRWLTACRSTIIQSSKTHPGLSNDPQKTLDEIFVNYVL
ncbi:DUF3037 domain-containing protein [Winogradskyella eximia]|uniref:DUF3037 domain-containing protein n=1 Tax=Winogradskyella eximia TaxID=262006 RepID=UPI0024913C8A|nr:DUF3037 domain-containing protein [Winogradskyella eximia]|tara:strand:- start:182 stop:565 length:384 start_codon:yes stop_codon:yes gene_type:complete